MVPAKRPTFVITLVHGTFAANAEWTLEDSRLSSALREKLDGQVLIERFSWSGKNSYAAREEAGGQLRRFLGELQQQYQSAHHIVIAHSHGGNVALYALNDPALAGGITGLVTLATPFLTCKAKNLALHLVILLGGGFFGLLSSFATYVLVPLTVRGLEYSHGFGRLLEIVVYIGVLVMSLTAGTSAITLVRWLVNELTEWCLDVMTQMQEELIVKLDISHCAQVPLLALRFKSDEARMWLLLLAVIAMPFSAVFRLAGRLLLVAWGVSMLMITADVVIEWVKLVHPMYIPAWPSTISGNLYWLCFLILGTTLIGVLLAPRMIRGHWLGFGKENLWTPILVDITPTELPENFTNAKIVRYSLWTALREMTAGRGPLSILNLQLLHSWLYQREATADDIGAWIKGISHCGRQAKA